MDNQPVKVPQARDLFEGDINAAVIEVQKLTGIEIDDVWWDENVGNDGTAEAILSRFDEAYAKKVAEANAA